MKNMKVSTRLQTGFGLLTALLLVLAGIALFGLSELNDSLDGIARVNNEETRLANELRASIQDRAIAIRNLALITEPRDLAQEADRIKKQDQELCGGLPATHSPVRAGAGHDFGGALADRTAQAGRSRGDAAVAQGDGSRTVAERRARDAGAAAKRAAAAASMACPRDGTRARRR